MRSHSLWALLLTYVLVSPQRNSSEVSAHSRLLECNSRQAVQTQPSDQTEWSLSQQVFNLWCSRWARPHVELFATRFSHKLSQVCFTSIGSNSLGSRCPDSAVGESGCLHLLSSLPARPHNLQGEGSRLSQDDSDCSRVVQHALVLGPGQFYHFRLPFQAPSTKDLVTQPFDRLLHRNLRNLNLHAWLLEPLPFRNKGSLKKWQQELKLLTDY